MIFLVQLLAGLNTKQIENFQKMFSDLEFELEEMGYKDCPEDLIDQLLGDHFGIYFTREDETAEWQLGELTKCILENKQGFNSACRMALYKVAR